MELIAATRPESVAFAYGAYLIDGGTRLRCGLLFVRKRNRRKVLTFRDPKTKTRIRVRLPELATQNLNKSLRFSRETLEVIS